MRLTNLLKETRDILKDKGYNSRDVAWVGSEDGRYSLPYGEFCELIADVAYDAGYGGHHISSELVIIMHDGSWFSRGEYDGSEWWDYNKQPHMRLDAKPFTSVKITENYTDPLRA